MAFNVVTVAGLAVSEIRDRRRRGLEVRYLETLWHVDRPHLLYTRRVERSLARKPFRPWGGKPLGVALVAVTIFAGTALASTGARRVATSVLATVAEGLGLRPAASEVAAAEPGQPESDEAAGDAFSDERHLGSSSSSDPSFAGVPEHGSAGDAPVTGGTGSPATPPGPSATPLESPQTPIALAVSSTEIDITWTDVSGETAYRIDRSIGGGPWGQVATTGPGVTSHSDTGLQPATTYGYRVVAVYPSGTAASGGAVTTTGIAPPDATTLSATPMSSTQVTLTWVDVGTETSYRIERSPDGATGWTEVSTLGQDQTSYTDTVSAATTCYYRVVAVNAAGGTASNVSQVTTPPEASAGTATDTPAA